MEYKIVELDNLSIIGISVNTTNQNDQSMKDIGELWNRFFQENIKDIIPNKISDDIYCVYTNYESDFTGMYTTIIGCKVSSIDDLTEKLVAKKIPQCNYQVYTSKGKITDCVGKTWAHIWQSNIDRKYEADFDIYGAEAHDPNNAVVSTYLSIK